MNPNAQVLRVLVSKYGAERVHPVHPREAQIEGLPVVTLPAGIATWGPANVAVSAITPPAAATDIISQASSAGVDAIWFQPGAIDARKPVWGNW